MNYYRARQIIDTKKWFYTRENDGVIYEVGFCNSCKGHDTPQEAVEHFKDYLVDMASFHKEDPNARSLHRCKVCNTFTFGYASTHLVDVFSLCEKHQTREDLRSILAVDELISSL